MKLPISFRLLSVVIFVLFLQSNSFANERDSLVYRIFNNIYNQNFNQAQRLLEENKSQLDPFYFNILQLDLSWWKFSLSKSEPDAMQLETILDYLEKANNDANNKNIYELIRLSYQMRFEVKRHNYMRAYFMRSDVKKQLGLVESEKKKLTGNQLKMFELYVVLLQYTEKASSPFSIIIPANNTETLQLLEVYSNNNDFIVSTIAHYFLGRIYVKIENQPKIGEAHFRVLASRFPQNKLFDDLASGKNLDF